MPIINSCCCSKSLRKGSFACGFYTLIYYTFIVVAGAMQFGTDEFSQQRESRNPYDRADAEVLYIGSLVLVISSCLTILSSVGLLFGLCVDNRFLLLPWIFSISFTTLIDFSYTVLNLWMSVVNPHITVIFVMDFFLCVLNIYCILCVVSQYQEYRFGRGDTGWYGPDEMQLPCSKYDRPPLYDNGFYTNGKHPYSNGLSLAVPCTPPLNRLQNKPNKDVRGTGKNLTNGNAPRGIMKNRVLVGIEETTEPSSADHHSPEQETKPAEQEQQLNGSLNGQLEHSAVKQEDINSVDRNETANLSVSGNSLTAGPDEENSTKNFPESTNENSPLLLPSPNSGVK